MLVLTRKLQEQIEIGDGITITVLRIKGNTVRLGIEAPREVRVRRAELAPLPVDNSGDIAVASHGQKKGTEPSGGGPALGERVRRIRAGRRLQQKEAGLVSTSI